MRYWIKLYTEIVHDPKMGRLTDRQFRTCINLFAMAGALDREGALPALDDMAWQLHMGTDALLDDLRALASVNIVTDEDGVWTICKWAERQAKAPSAAPDKVLQRVHEHRDRQRNEAQNQRNESVTTLHLEVKRDVTPPETETDKETETDSETEKTTAPVVVVSPYGMAIRNFENEIGLVSGSYADDMKDMWALLESAGTTGWWDKSIKLAVEANKRSWSYMRGILSNCLQEGHAPGERNGKGGQHATSRGNGNGAGKGFGLRRDPREQPDDEPTEAQRAEFLSASPA